MKSAEQEFGHIYRSEAWSSDSRSGPGSVSELNQPYLDALRTVIKSNGIKTVVDIGCGDWSLYRGFDWQRAVDDYHGFDVVPDLIDRLQADHACDSIHFSLADLSTSTPPVADLWIVKDILQHWPNDRVSEFLTKLGGCRFALITNDIDCRTQSHNLVRRFARHVIQPFVGNLDTTMGGYRQLKLGRSPFKLKTERILTYKSRWQDVVFTKEVLLYRNTAAR